MSGKIKLLFFSLAVLILGVYFSAAAIKGALATSTPDSNAIAAAFDVTAQTPSYVAELRQPCLDRNPQRNAYFGALHIHTDLSSDAAGWGTLASPADAYRFAQGESQSRRVRSEASTSLANIQLTRPLDFAAVTDHAKNFGESALCLNPGSDAYQSAVCKVFRGDLSLPVAEHLQAIMRMAVFPLFQDKRPASVCGEDGMACIEASRGVWDQLQRAAEHAYDRSEHCRFTSFVAYEYSLAIEGSNLHRNVIFKNATVPQIPLSANEAGNPEALWAWLKSACLDASQECDVLAIPHNSNWSSGRMFYPYSKRNISVEEQQTQAQLRQRIEPLAEVLQVKGDSECRNGLSGVVGAPDELCDFEKLRAPMELAEDCGDEFGRDGMKLSGCLSRYSYTRYALAAGLDEKQKLGINPFKFGLIAASDNHTGKGGVVEEYGFKGSTSFDRTPAGRLRDPLEIPTLAKADATRFNPGGLAGVWAEENSRDALFEAMQRRETFGTSGPRIEPRFFAAWSLPENLCEQTDMLDIAYRDGVPMGSDLPANTNNEGGPSFLISASKGPQAEDGPLQKLQLIKSWINKDGQMSQRVVDVAGDSASTATVNLQTCERQGKGYANLCTVWQDDEFDSELSAVYYTRAVETPSCRWTHYDCNTFSDEERPKVCSSLTLPKTIQERAWSSPIWYEP